MAATDTDSHWQHSDSPSDSDPSRPGRHCGPHCDLYEPAEPEDADEQRRDLAAEAWHGGQVLRDHYARLGAGADMQHVTYWARKLAAGQVVERYGTMREFDHNVRLPEAAFDWPIYQAALGREVR